MERRMDQEDRKCKATVRDLEGGPAACGKNAFFGSPYCRIHLVEQGTDDEVFEAWTKHERSIEIRKIRQRLILMDLEE